MVGPSNNPCIRCGCEAVANCRMFGMCKIKQDYDHNPYQQSNAKEALGKAFKDYFDRVESKIKGG